MAEVIVRGTGAELAEVVRLLRGETRPVEAAEIERQADLLAIRADEIRLLREERDEARGMADSYGTRIAELQAQRDEWRSAAQDAAERIAELQSALAEQRSTNLTLCARLAEAGVT